MITIEDLIFEKAALSKLPQGILCNCCGNVINGGDAFTASYEFANDSDLTIVICSEVCLNKFKSHPQVNIYIQNALDRAKHVRNNKRQIMLRLGQELGLFISSK